MNGHKIYLKFASLFSRFFSTKFNPFYHLGSISVLSFLIATITGLYLFIFYKIDPSEAYNSTEMITRQWVGGIMRSLHRYSSDALVITALLHFLHQLIIGKYKRFLPWVTGFISFLLVLILGLTGFFLVWDEKAKLIGFLSTKLLTSISIVNPSLSGMFITEDLQALSGFFRIAFAVHFFLTLFFVVILYLHVVRISKPMYLPPKKLWYLVTISLVFICFLFPVISDAPASSSPMPYHSSFDWYYFAGFYFLKFISAKWLLLWLVLTVAALSSIPLFVRKTNKLTPVIDKENCNACKQCQSDCPYDAISIKYFGEEQKAELNQSRCVSCGICNASCKHGAITFSVLDALKTTDDLANKELAIYSCSYFPIANIDSEKIKKFVVPCVGSVHVNDVEKVFEHGVKGVVFAACESCYHRYGSEWETLRLSHKRRPTLESKYSLNNIRFLKLPSANLKSELEKFQSELNSGAISIQDKKSFIKEYLKPNYVVATIISLLLSLSIPLLSNRDVAFFPKDRKILILNFKYTSSPTETQSYATLEKHMSSLKPIVLNRSAIEIKIISESGQELYSKKYSPHGFRKNSTITIYDEVLLNGKVKVILTETEVAGIIIESPLFEMRGSEVLTLSEKQFVLSH